MERNPVVQASIDEILDWLNSNREVAASIYVRLRHDLAKIFDWNHCPDPEGLTDEVIDRVSRKIGQVRDTYEGDPRLYFYGVARNLIKESNKKIKTYVSLDDVELVADSTLTLEEESMCEKCLHRCLAKLSTDKREMVLAYYAQDKQAKIDLRAQMARRLGLSVETLRVRVFRVRGALDECIQRCIELGESQR